jgi:hypothetical protein
LLQQLPLPLRKKRANASDRSTFFSGYSFDTSVHLSMCAAVWDDVKLEIDNYKAEPTIDTDDEPLEYWKANSRIYPILSTLVRRYLSPPATSVASEQTFSVATRVYDDLRCSLSAEKAEQLIFINKALPIVGNNY